MSRQQLESGVWIVAGSTLTGVRRLDFTASDLVMQPKVPLVFVLTLQNEKIKENIMEVVHSYKFTAIQNGFLF